jgi:hypothetical protein
LEEEICLLDDEVGEGRGYVKKDLVAAAKNQIKQAVLAT